MVESLTGRYERACVHEFASAGPATASFMVPLIPALRATSLLAVLVLGCIAWPVERGLSNPILLLRLHHPPPQDPHHLPSLFNRIPHHRPPNPPPLPPQPSNSPNQSSSVHPHLQIPPSTSRFTVTEPQSLDSHYDPTISIHPHSPSTMPRPPPEPDPSVCPPDGPCPPREYQHPTLSEEELIDICSGAQTPSLTSSSIKNNVEGFLGGGGLQQSDGGDVGEGWWGEGCGYCKEVVACGGGSGRRRNTNNKVLQAPPSGILCDEGLYCRMSAADSGESQAGCFAVHPLCSCPEEAVPSAVGHEEPHHTTRGLMHPDPYDARTYFICDSVWGQRFYRCPHDAYFEPANSTCVFIPTTTPPPSTTPFPVVDPGDAALVAWLVTVAVVVLVATVAVLVGLKATNRAFRVTQIFRERQRTQDRELTQIY